MDGRCKGAEAFFSLLSRVWRSCSAKSLKWFGRCYRMQTRDRFDTSDRRPRHAPGRGAERDVGPVCSKERLVHSPDAPALPRATSLRPDAAPLRNPSLFTSGRDHTHIPPPTPPRRAAGHQPCSTSWIETYQAVI